MLLPEEKNIITTEAKAMGLSANAYIRLKIFRSPGNLTSKRSPLANNSIPEINVDVYRALCDIACSLREITKLARGLKDLASSPVQVDQALLKQTLSLVKKVGLKIASNKN